jgi:hypothetical protein
MIVVGHAFVRNMRRGHYELAVEEPPNRRLAVAFGELAWRSEARHSSQLQHAVN